MYQFKSSLVLTNNGWIEKNISNETFHSLYTTYKKVYVNLFEDVQDKAVQLDLDLLKSQHYFSVKTLKQYLIDNGNLFISGVVEKHKKLNLIKRVKYIDHSHNLVKLRPTEAGFGYDKDRIGIHTPDLEITTPNYTANSCFATVNGYAHQVIDANSSSYILNGYKTILSMNESSYGLYDFSELGQIVTTQITTNNLHDTDYGFDVKLDSTINEHSIILLSINGLLFRLGEGCFQSSDISIGIKRGDYNWADMTFNTMDELDSRFTLTNLHNPHQAAVIKELYSNKHQREMLTTVNSFVVVITPHDTTQPIAEQLETLYDNGASFGVYKGYYPPNGIMRNAIKQCCVYNNSLADDECVVRTKQYQTPKYVYKTAGDRVLRTPVDTHFLTWSGDIVPQTIGSELGYWVNNKASHAIVPTPFIKDSVEIGLLKCKNIDLQHPTSGGYFILDFRRHNGNSVNLLSSYDVVSFDDLNISRLDVTMSSGTRQIKTTLTRDYYAQLSGDVWQFVNITSNTKNNRENDFINFMVNNPGKITIKLEFYKGVIPPSEYLEQYIDTTVDLNQNGWEASPLTSLNLYQLK